jgi:acyl carrier protein
VDDRTAIRQFLQHLLGKKGDHQPFSDSDSLVFSGRLQSIDVVDVVVFLEEKWNIDFARLGFDTSQVDSVEAIDALISPADVSRPHI